MASRTEDPGAYARKRAYFSNRAIAEKRRQEGSRLETSRMTDVALWEEATRALLNLEASNRLHAAPDEMADVQNALKALLELRHRGLQLQLGLLADGGQSRSAG